MCALVGCAAASSPVRGAASAPAEGVLSRAAALDMARSDSSAPLLLTAAQSETSGPQPLEQRATDAELPWLSPIHIGAAVREHHGDFQACQALGDLESRREDGAVTVGWLVKADGSVNDVTVGPSTFASRSINTCVLKVARQVTFPRSAAPTHVSWTVKFRAAPHGSLADSTPR